MTAGYCREAAIDSGRDRTGSAKASGGCANDRLVVDLSTMADEVNGKEAIFQVRHGQQTVISNAKLQHFA